MIPTKKTEKKANNTGFVATMITVWVAVIVLSFFIGRYISLQNAEKTLTRTVEYLKDQCISYDEIILSDKVKSLVRLTEKASEVAFHFTKDQEEYPKDWLNEFAVNQRISAIKVVDKDLRTVFSYSETPDDGIWDTLTGDTVRSVIEKPKTVYAERVKKNNLYYDIAVVSRQDAEGAVLCCFQQDEEILDTKQSTVENLLASHELVLNGKIFITEKDRIIGTNITDSNNTSTDSFPLIKELEKQPVSEKLIRLTQENGYAWYAGKASCRNYGIYIFYPAKNVFSECFVIMSAAVIVYIIFVISAIALRIRNNQVHLKEIKDKYEIIGAISNIFVSSVLIDIKNSSYYLIKSKNGIGKRAGTDTAAEFVTGLCLEHVGEEYRKEYAEFIDLETLGDRLAGKNDIYYIYQNSDGIWFQDILVEKERDKDGKLCSALLIVRNINDFKQKEISYQKQLEQAVEKERQANNAKTDFLRRMSHDIRTPINVIIGMTTIARKNREDIETRDYCNDKTLGAAAFLLELVDDVLTINKLDSGETELKEEKFVLNDVVSDIVSMISAQALIKHVTVTPPEITAEHSAFIGDALSFRQIILNITANAVKYNKDGGKVMTSFTEIQRDGKTFIRFVCEDTGIGMSPEYQKHMFEPFSQENSTVKNAFGGIGLGLPVVSKMTEAMGGEVEVESEKDVGTKFTVTLPFTPTVAEEGKTAEDEPKRLDGIKVLMAEDNELNAEIAEFFLKDSGAEVTCVSNGKEAVEAFERSAPGEFDIILLDMMMPVMNGTKAAEVIRKLERPDAETIPIFAMTANLFENDIEECKKAGMDEHIAKPLNAAKLTETIFKYVRKKRGAK